MAVFIAGRLHSSFSVVGIGQVHFTSAFNVLTAFNDFLM